MYSKHHALFHAHRVTLAGSDEGALTHSLASARVDLNPHQVDAALFALRSPLSKGAVLADEVGLGKTIEAALVIAQRWAERRHRLLLIVPASLRKQWEQELAEKFGLPTLILDAPAYRAIRKEQSGDPLDRGDAIIIMSYEFAARLDIEIARIPWDLVVFDEAHRLRNVWRSNGAIRAKRLKDALRDRFKLLLTATPLQNSLMELYGLVSVVDEQVFGDEDSFRTLFEGGDAASIALLKDRLRAVSRRTLRRQVQEAGHISFTERRLKTFTFDPPADEVQLYERVSAFLQRNDTITSGGRQNALLVMGVRKILGSSTFAVAQTLANIIARLEKRQRPGVGELADIETAAAVAEEASPDIAEREDEIEEEEPVDPVQLAKEIEELRSYHALAERIGSNAKGEKLVEALPHMLDAVVKLNGQRKAVIFTESVRTQRYLAKLLSDKGYGGQIVLMNGSNSDTESKVVYADWVKRHREAGRTSRSKSADMKAAIVESFRDNKTILIATESGAEGINLQFCSLLFNFDLPWNPQRVEQRIGRCHRYGQLIDVTVVNLLNLRNRAEQRVHELLEQKFRLFTGVFGASDEVLGALESGLDFERKAVEIVQSCRSDAEISARFDELQETLAPEIDSAMLAAREKLLAEIDAQVVQRLKTRKGEIDRSVGEYEQRLIAIAASELDGAVFDTERPDRFQHDGATWTVSWPNAEKEGLEFFRLADEGLAHDAVEAAKGHALRGATIRFDVSAYAKRFRAGILADVERLKGKSGYLSVSKLTIKSAKMTAEELLISGVRDDGTRVDAETLDRLFLAPGDATDGCETPPADKLREIEEDLRKKRIMAREDENERFFQEETDKLYRWSQDVEDAASREGKSLDKEIRQKRKEARSAALSMEQKVTLAREIKRLERQRDDIVLSAYQRRREIEEKVEEQLDLAQAALRVEPTVSPLFTIRWEVAP